MRAVCLAILVVVTSSATSHTQGVNADQVNFGPVPPVLPKGGQMAPLSGDPGKPGTFTVRLKMPAGYKIPPHQHPHVERVTVISGEFRYGAGDTLDQSKANRLGPGGFVELPSNQTHYAFAEVETIIQISAEGPFGIKYANPADDPSKGQ